MKTLILSLFVLFSAQSAFATSLHPETFNQDFTYYSLEPIGVEVSPLCPENATCVTDGTVVDLTYEVGCYEEEVYFNYQADVVDGKIHLFTNMVVKSVVKGGGPVCLAFTTVNKKITLPMMFGEVVLHNLKVTN